MNARVQLKDIASFSKGEQINGENLIEDGVFPYLNGGIQPSGRWSDYNTPGNTITISEGGNSCGYVNLMAEPFWCGAHCYYLYDLSVDVQYLYFALKSQQTRLMGIRSGACMPNIKKNDLGCFELTIHTDVTEQKHIVEQLQVCQAIIEQRQRQLRALDTLIKARFVEMFGESDYPQMTLDDVIVPGAGLSYGIIVPGDYFKDGSPMVRPSDYQNGKLDLRNVYRVNPEIEAKYSRTRLQGNEILVQVIGQPGQIIPATEECKGMNVTRNLAVVRPNSMIIDRTYLVEFMRTETAQRYITGSTKQSTLKQLPLSLLKSLVIPIPPIEQQLEFDAFVSQVDKSKVVVQKALDEAQLLFDSLMQQYFGLL